jgi:tetratricopeptide (TPR) repeat protein
MRFEYFTTRGRALMGVGLLSEAVNEWLEANKIYNSDIEVLNSLGFCYFKVGKKKEALDTLRASLRLNSAQDDIKKLIAEIEKTLK